MCDDGAGMELEVTELFENGSGEEISTYNNTLVGKSSAMRELYDLMVKVARSDTTVLISGESGTGKELVAKTIHRLSSRPTRPFVPVNCAAIPEELLESELFGHVRGAFTGAVNARQGRFQLAHKSTLFLDEVGEMSAKLQVKLLRVLQEWEFEPVGSDKAVRVDVRLVAATNQDLSLAVREGRFREDLFYRLNVIPINLPPLRERREDIPLLVSHFLQHHCRKKGKVVERVQEEVLAVLQRYSWPGNVREVENLMERLVVLNEGGTIRVRDLPEYILNPPKQDDNSLLSNVSLPGEGLDLDGFLQEIENRLIVQALALSQGKKALAADLLRLNRTTLVERMRRRGLVSPWPNSFPLPLSGK